MSNRKCFDICTISARAIGPFKLPDLQLAENHYMVSLSQRLHRVLPQCAKGRDRVPVGWPVSPLTRFEVAFPFVGSNAELQYSHTLRCNAELRLRANNAANCHKIAHRSISL